MNELEHSYLLHVKLKVADMISGLSINADEMNDSSDTQNQQAEHLDLIIQDHKNNANTTVNIEMIHEEELDNGKEGVTVVHHSESKDEMAERPETQQNDTLIAKEPINEEADQKTFKKDKIDISPRRTSPLDRGYRQPVHYASEIGRAHV